MPDLHRDTLVGNIAEGYQPTTPAGEDMKNDMLQAINEAIRNPRTISSSTSRKLIDDQVYRALRQIERLTDWNGDFHNLLNDYHNNSVQDPATKQLFSRWLRDFYAN